MEDRQYAFKRTEESIIVSSVEHLLFLFFVWKESAGDLLGPVRAFEQK